MKLDEAVALGRVIEEVDFDRLGIYDVILWPDTFLVQALCSQATSRAYIHVSSRCPCRHAASTQELSTGRAFLGLGRRAGRDVIDVEVASRLTLCVSTDAAAARRTI